jgi:hypothetical protein
VLLCLLVQVYPTYIKYHNVPKWRTLPLRAYSLMNADETKSVSLLIDDVTYSVTPYVMARLTRWEPV